MYPKNAASPPPIAIGAVIQISDGAVQTTGVTVYHRTSGTTETSGGGTTNVGATSGTIYYTPTQAETNYESFELVAFKTGCIPACVTVVTSASATSGKVVLSGETHTSAVIPTVTTLTGHTAQTGDAYGVVNAKLVGTLAAGTHVAQSGDSYGVVNSGTYGNSALRTILTSTGVPLTSAERTTLAAAIEAAIINELDGAAVMQAIADLIASDMTTTDLTVAAIASAVRDSVLNRVLAGNHDTAGSVGKVLQDVLEDTGTTLPATLTAITQYVDCLPATLDGSTLTSVPWNASWDAEVQSECDDAITANATLKRIAVGAVGDLSGAGTGTEELTYGGVTATATVDSSGNRTIVFS